MGIVHTCILLASRLGEYQLRKGKSCWKRAQRSNDRTDRRSVSLNTVPRSEPRNFGNFDRAAPSCNKRIAIVVLPLFKTNYIVHCKNLPIAPPLLKSIMTNQLASFRRCLYDKKLRQITRLSMLKEVTVTEKRMVTVPPQLWVKTVNPFEFKFRK